MSLTRLRARVPIGVQVGVVAALFVAALIVLWMTGASVLARERRRSEAKVLLERAGKNLAERGRDTLAHARNSRSTPRADRTELDRKLGRTGHRGPRAYHGVEGGYLVSASRASWARSCCIRTTGDAAPSGRRDAGLPPAGRRACRRSRPT